MLNLRRQGMETVLRVAVKFESNEARVVAEELLIDAIG